MAHHTILHSRLSNPGKLISFNDAVTSVRKCTKYLISQGVNKIIALGHAGISMDERIAREVEEVDIVVGGHTNTFLYTGRYCVTMFQFKTTVTGHKC